jgi:hypothetical protein
MKTLRLQATALVLGLVLSGCLYSDVRGPLSYRSPTPSDVGGKLGEEAHGSACNTAILWLVAFGDGGYDAAVKDARESSHAVLIADVKADTSYTNVVFGIYQRQCTTVTGRVVPVSASAAPEAITPPSAPPAPPPASTTP